MELTEFNIELAGAGWADVTFGTANSVHTVVVSDLYDSIAELAAAAISLLSGDVSEILVTFADEPGEHRLILLRSGREALTFRVLSADGEGTWGILAPTDFQPVVSGTTTIPWFCRQVLAVLRHIDAICTDEEYENDLWTAGPFPRKEYERLRALVEKLDP